MIPVIDDYDSLTWNLVQYLGEPGADPLVRRNDEATPDEISSLAPEAILLSPGPKRPTETESTNATFRACAGKLPIPGVRLGHWCLAHMFRGLPDPFPATRYRVLPVERESLPVARVCGRRPTLGRPDRSGGTNGWRRERCCARLEGILPAPESAHAFARIRKLAPCLAPDDLVVINLSGRGDRDVQVALGWFGARSSVG